MKEKSIRAIIIDDELHCIDTLVNLLNKYHPEVAIEGTFTSSKEGLLALRAETVDVVFLDVEMPWMNGIELLMAYGEVDFQVIFTTAHDKYAVQAFRLSAIDYLLKPVNEDDLHDAVDKASQAANPNINESVEMLNLNLQSPATKHRVAIPTKEGIDFILIERILYCTADSNYTHIYLKDKHILMSKPLKELEKQLNPYNFCRIHHSYLINLNHLVKYVRGNAGYVVMVDGKNLNVSRAKKTLLLEKLGYI